MAVELSYVIVTPYSLKKSRTGGIITRLLSRTGLELVGAQVVTPDRKLAEDFAKSIEESIGKTDKVTAKIFSDYVMENFTPLPDGRRERLLLLLFQGEDACKKLYSVVGCLPNSKNRKEGLAGETIRDTYSDMVYNRDGSLQYFEPAVFTPPDFAGDIERLDLIAKFAEKAENVVSNIVDCADKTERTLVIIKPDNWRTPSVKPGNIIDMFSRTGLKIVGCKVYRMSVAQALEFYGPVQGALRKKLAPSIALKAKAALEEKYGITMREESAELLTKSFGFDFADDQFNQIVEFMSGVRPDRCPANELDAPGKVKCMALIYEGTDAIAKIRNVLGPTDPTKAPVGTIRREFGTDVMVNSAHASDCQESFDRETRVIEIAKNNLASIIREYLKSL